MLKKGLILKPLQSTTWMDIGNPDSLKFAREHIRELYPN
jgi:hypothetical protein